MGVGFELQTELKEEKLQRQNKILQICGTPLYRLRSESHLKRGDIYKH